MAFGRDRGQTSNETTEVVAEVMTDLEPVKYTREELAGIVNFEDALAAASTAFGSLEDASQVIGDGFTLLGSDQKNLLVGVTLLWLEWQFQVGDYGEFVSARVVARQPNGSAAKYILNDGSTGIYRQLKEYTESTGRSGGLLTRSGLRRSDYDYTDAKGDVHPASTFYLDTAAS